MKKSLAAIFSVLALLVFTSSAFALHGVKEMFEYTPNIVKSKKSTITLGGSIRVRGEINDNLKDFRKTDDDYQVGTVSSSPPVHYEDSNAFYDQRVRLHLDAAVSPNTRGFVELETAYGSYGSDGYKWGYGFGTDARGVYGAGNDNTKRTALYLRQAYVAHQGTGLLGMLSGFKAGHMLLALGNGLFFNHSKFGDDALVFWVSPADGTEISFTTIKLDEGASTILPSDEADAYVLAGEHAMDGINLSGDVTYVVDNNSPVKAGEHLRLWNFGLRGATDVQGINVKADVEFQTGKSENSAANGDDFKLGGYALLVSADTKVGDINVGAEFAYGSGDDKDTEKNYDGFITSLSAGQKFSYIYDNKVATAGQAIATGATLATLSSTYAGAAHYGLNNTWYLNVGASTNVNPDLKVATDVYYLQASKKVSDDTSTMTDSKDLGFELDGKVTYQIDNNFVYYVEAGYLWAGKFYENITNDKDNIDNPWSVRHGVVLKF